MCQFPQDSLGLYRPGVQNILVRIKFNICNNAESLELYAQEWAYNTNTVLPHQQQWLSCNLKLNISGYSGERSATSFVAAHRWRLVSVTGWQSWSSYLWSCSRRRNFSGWTHGKSDKKIFSLDRQAVLLMTTFQ